MDPTNTLVPQSCFGILIISRTFTIVTSTEILLFSVVFNTIVSIMNTEHPDPCVGQTYFENHGATKSEQVLNFCRLSCIQRISPTSIIIWFYMIHKSEILDKYFHINCLHRVKVLGKLSNFRTVQNSDCSSQY